MRHHLRTRIVLANSAHARWIERDGGSFITLTELEGEALAAPHPAATAHQRFGVGRHATNGADLARKDAERFAAVIAEHLEKEEAEFDRLALVAPPRMLAALREALSPTIRQKLVHELPKDLVKAPNHKLDTRLSSVMFG